MTTTKVTYQCNAYEASCTTRDAAERKLARIVREGICKFHHTIVEEETTP